MPAELGANRFADVSRHHGKGGIGKGLDHVFLLEFAQVPPIGLAGAVGKFFRKFGKIFSAFCHGQDAFCFFPFFFHDFRFFIG